MPGSGFTELEFFVLKTCNVAISVVAANKSLNQSAKGKLSARAFPNSPLNSGKHNRRHTSLIHTPATIEADATNQAGQRNEAREPEDHRQRLGDQNAELVRGGLEMDGCEDEICEGEHGPYRAEEEEVGFGRRPEAAPIVHHCLH